MKYSVITFGCRVNQADSLALEEQLRAMGASATASDEADLVVVNTCSVTASSDQGARQTIRRIARVNPDARIVVTGCYATRRPDEIGQLPNVVGVVRNDEKPSLLELVRGVPLRAGRTISDALTTAERFGAGGGACGSAIEPGMAGRTAFTLRVQTGCAEPCSYCIIPSTRGVPRSVPVGAILQELERIAGAGFKEVALTGVHLGSYGRDLSPPSSLRELLSEIAGRWGCSMPRRHGQEPALGVRRARIGAGDMGSPGDGRDLRFRISSLEPMDCSSDIVDLVAECECFAAHFHLPLQHASNPMLASMRRPYTIEQYAALVDAIRTRLHGASIGSDIIVGFPGETDDDFARLASYLEGSPLTHLHVFPYSDRPGTAAAEMDQKVPGVIVRERTKRIRDISGRLATQFRESQTGTVHRALTLEDGLLAVTGNYLKVSIPPGQARNEWVRIRITGAVGPAGTMAGTLSTGSETALPDVAQR